jgi:hypothetical protein
VSKCCGTQSREHYITKGLFSGKQVYINGAPFLGGGSKEIAKAKLTKKCLCSKHNSQLSHLDNEAIKFGKSLKYALELSLQRRQAKKKRFSIHREFIDQDIFCKWFIKTYIGLVDFFKKPSLIDSDSLAMLVFSDKSIKRNVELSVAMEVGEDFVIKEVVSVALLYSDDFIVGLQVELYGIRVKAVFSKVEKLSKQFPILQFNERGINERGKVPSCEIHFQ